MINSGSKRTEDAQLASVVNKSKTITDETNLRNQISSFRIGLDKNDTIFYHAQCPKRLVMFMTMTTLLLFILDNSVNSWYLQSIIFSMICLCFGFATLIILISKVNIYIIKECIKTFTMWYKCVHTFIALMARQIYYNFWIYDESINGADGDAIFTDIPPNVGNNNLVYYFYGVLVCVSFTGIIFAVSCLDGLHSNSNKIKRIFNICVILMYTWFYIESYFNMYDEYITNPNKSFTINILGRKHEYYWRSIAL